MGLELGATWNPKTYSTFDLSLAHEPNETDGTGSYIRATGGLLTWNHEWSSRFVHDANFGYSKEKFVGLGTTRSDNLYSAGAGIAYQVFDWLNIGLSYNYSLRKSNVANASYHGNHFGFNFSGTL